MSKRKKATKAIRQVTLRMEADQFERVVAEAAKNRRSITAQLMFMIDDALNELPKTHKTTTP
jgi:hypothetical protein